MTNYAFDKLPATSGEAIQDFQDRYLALQQVGPVGNWADEFGDVIPTDSPKVRFPFSQLSTKFEESTGQNRFKTSEEDDFEIKTVEFDVGCEESEYNLTKSPWAWRRWQMQPQRFMTAEAQLKQVKIATLLNGGDAIPCKPTDAFFFDTAHKSNRWTPGAATWSNLASGAIDVVDIDNIEEQATLMSSSVLDENGDLLGVEPDVIICHPTKARKLRNLLSKEFINSGESNPEKGKFRVVSARQLLNTTDWYLIDSQMVMQGLAPWAILEEIVNEMLGLRVYDQSSELFRDSGKVALSKHVWKGFGLAMPWAIRKVDSST